MKSIRGRILNRLKTIPSSIYPTKQQPIVVECPNYYHYTEQEHKTKDDHDQEWESGAREQNTSRQNNGGGHINGSQDKLPIQKEKQPLDHHPLCNPPSLPQVVEEVDDVFEECETGTDHIESFDIDPLPKPKLISPSPSPSPSPPPPTNNMISSTICTTDKTDVVDEESHKQHLLDENFEEKCPPGGKETIILYTTSLRGIRKTFEDCHAIKFLLGSFNVVYYERDVSMHLKFRDELWKTLGRRVIPPRLFIKGKHIGGADEVVKLNEQGKLKSLLQGLPLVTDPHPSTGIGSIKCGGCGGLRFVVCLGCNGSRKVFKGSAGNGNKGILMFSRCLICNENGLIKCPTCCS